MALRGIDADSPFESTDTVFVLQRDVLASPMESKLLVSIDNSAFHLHAARAFTVIEYSTICVARLLGLVGIAEPK